MARFRTLSEAVRYHVEQLASVTEIPSTLPLSVQAGRKSAFDDDSGRPDSIVLRWGVSTWGVEPATGYLFPGVIATDAEVDITQ